jgi:hypothetical protein
LKKAYQLAFLLIVDNNFLSTGHPTRATGETGRKSVANNRWAVGKPLDLTQVAGRATSAEPPGQRTVSQAHSSSQTRGGAGGGSSLEGLVKPSWWGSYDSSSDVEDDVGQSRSMTPTQHRHSQAACSMVIVSQCMHPPDQQSTGPMTPHDSQFCRPQDTPAGATTPRQTTGNILSWNTDAGASALNPVTPRSARKMGATLKNDSSWDIDSIHSKGRATGQCVCSGV